MGRGIILDVETSETERKYGVMKMAFDGGPDLIRGYRLNEGVYYEGGVREITHKHWILAIVEMQTEYSRLNTYWIPLSRLRAPYRIVSYGNQPPPELCITLPQMDGSRV